MRTKSLSAAVLIVAVTLLSGWSSRARNQAASSATPITTVVTVLGHDFSAPPPIVKEDVTVYSGKNRQDVTSWVPAQGDNAGLQLAILIDDDDSPTAIGQHFSEIKEFITSQPSTTQVGLFYATAGTARAAAQFDANHEAVAQKLRMTLGPTAGTSPSVYLSLEDLVSHWPANGMRHEVLMIASGIDRLSPGIDSPYVASAIKRAQASGVVVHSIYTGGPRLANSQFRMDVAWQNLDQIASGTGGQSFFQGFETPVDFVPIFRQLDAVLKNQYLLTFTTPRSEKKNGEMRQIQVRTEQRNVKLYHASEVFVPGP
ncbi:MAG TPA: hypothetical protein VJW93_12215 [Candidatus Acidoferrales bacterium]|nr:hypothetical protein [Candidatus Acidoferrales bacterium]